MEQIPGDRDQVDFWSVAVHEIGHVMGFNENVEAFKANISGSVFVGVRSTSLFGGPVPLGDDLVHWKHGTLYNGEALAMDPTLNHGVRVGFSELDFAALADIGYELVPGAGQFIVSSLRWADELLILEWRNGFGPFHVWQSGDLATWNNVDGTITNHSIRVSIRDIRNFFRVEDTAR